MSHAHVVVARNIRNVVRWQMNANDLNKKSTDMKEEFSLLRYTIEMIYIKKLNELKWWQFSKRKEVNKWRESELQKC